MNIQKLVKAEQNFANKVKKILYPEFKMPEIYKYWKLRSTKKLKKVDSDIDSFKTCVDERAVLLNEFQA